MTARELPIGRHGDTAEPAAVARITSVDLAVDRGAREQPSV